ncbi:MAG TPA: hypothetical protein VGR50_01360, partial [Terriglobales bacterium]|nr:hypothetical protein [Terriglobales bacterium]
MREFLQDSESSILGELTRGNSKANFCRLEKAQTDAWSTEIGTLKTCLSELSTGSPSVGNWGILLEYPIPRRQKRIDAVLLVGSIIVVIEFKCGLSQRVTEASVQVEDYALDLADFHEPSHKRTIIPIAVAHDAEVAPLGVAAAGVQPVLTAPPSALARLLEDIRRDAPARLGEPINVDGWNHGRYTPVPTVIEAALAIFAGMEVREIAHAHADAKNLTVTVD